MTSRRRPRHRTPPPAVIAVVIALCLSGIPEPAHADAPRWADHTSPEAPREGRDLAQRGWRWPLAGFHVTEGYVQPDHAYAAGHRGVDLRFAHSPDVVAPASGVVAFAGPVAGRGIITIDHGDGLVTTLEPVVSELRPGDSVVAGDIVAQVTLGGHSGAGELHFGVRQNGEYINPLLLLGGVPRAVLLPCC